MISIGGLMAAIFYRGVSVNAVDPEFPRNYHYERRGALKIQGLA
jgi:hypothetical protein